LGDKYLLWLAGFDLVPNGFQPPGQPAVHGRQLVGQDTAQAHHPERHQGCDEGTCRSAAANLEVGAGRRGELIVHKKDYNTENSGQSMLYYWMEIAQMYAHLEESLEDIKVRLVRELNPQQIILFGSHAYGRPGVDSDVDLLIIMDSHERPVARAAMVSRLLRPRPFPIDILVRTPEEIRYRLEIGDQFMREIFERGRVLYDQRVSR
jgi:predicted nucleotidyltransferase